MPFKLPEPEEEFVIPEPEEETFQLRPGVSTVIRSQSLPPKKIPEPIKTIGETITGLHIAGQASREGLLNLVKRIGNIAAQGGDVLGLGIEPPFEEKTEMQQLAGALRKTQTLPQNILAGAMGAAPFLIPGAGQALFAADIATQPEHIPEQIRDIGQTFKDVGALADPFIQAGPLKAVVPEIEEAERAEAKERLRQRPVESAFNILLPTSIFVGGVKAPAKIAKKVAPLERLVTPEKQPVTPVVKAKIPEVIPPVKPVRLTEKAKAKLEREGVVPPSPKPEIKETIIIPKPIPKVVPPKLEKPPSSDKVIGLSKEGNRKLHLDFPMKELNVPERQAATVAFNEAKIAKMDESALTLSQAIIKSPKPISTQEHAGMALKFSELANEFERIIQFKDERNKVGDKRGAADQTTLSEVVLKQMEDITEAANVGGTELSRAFNFRKALINRETFELAGVTQRARAAKGGPLSPKETAKVEVAVKRHKELETKIKELEASNDKLLAEQDAITAAKITKSEARKTVSAKKKQTLTQERIDIKKDIAALGFRVNDITGLTAEGSFQIGRLAVNYIKEGARTLEDVVAKVISDVPDLKPRDVHQALNARNPKLQAKARTAVQKRIAGLKTQAKLTEELALIGEGIWGTPKKRPLQSVAIQKFQKRISDLKRQRDLVGEVEAGKRGVFRDTAKKIKRTQEIEKLEKELANLKTEDRLTKEIAQAEKGIFKKPKTRVQQLESIKALQKKLRELKAEAFKSTKDSDRLQAIDFKIRELQDQLHNQMRIIKKKQQPESAVITEAKSKLKELRSLIRIEDEITGLNEQMRTGVFEVPKEILPKRESEQLQRARIDLQITRKKVRGIIEGMAPLVTKRFPFVTKEGVIEGVNTLRTAKATADMSYFARQGAILTPRNPKIAARALGNATKSAFNRFTAEQLDNGMRSVPHHYIREKSKLYLSPVGEGAKLSAREELFSSNFLENLPTWSVAGPIVRASNRNMAIGLNVLRTSVFDDFYFKFKDKGITQSELAVYASFINKATGRGDLGQFAAAANILSLGIFAPRFAISRPQAIFFPLTKDFRSTSPRVRRAIAENLVTAASTGMAVLTLAGLAGLKVGLNPNDSDFGKIRYKNTSFDIWAGEQQVMRLIIRLGLTLPNRTGLTERVTGIKLTGRQKRIMPLDMVSDFLQYKLSPAALVPFEIASGRTVIGEPVTFVQSIARTLQPIIVRDIIDAWGVDGPNVAALAGSAAFFGIGTASFKRGRRRGTPGAQQLTDEQIRKALEGLK